MAVETTSDHFQLRVPDLPGVNQIAARFNRLRKPAEVVEAGPTEEVLLLREIRDSLNK